MITKEDIDLIVGTSIRIGIAGEFLGQMEGVIKQSIDIILKLQEEEPDNKNLPDMLSLFVASKGLIDAHKFIMEAGEMAMRSETAVPGILDNFFKQKGPETIQ